MAERALRLQWSKGRDDIWRADCGRMTLEAENDWGVDWRLMSDANPHGVPLERGVEQTLLAAQLAAEASALAWLSDGVAALGARTLDAGEVALCVLALRWTADGGPTSRGQEAQMLALARKLGEP